MIYFLQIFLQNIEFSSIFDLPNHANMIYFLFSEKNIPQTSYVKVKTKNWHSRARANLKKSKKVLTSTTTA